MLHSELPNFSMSEGMESAINVLAFTQVQALLGFYLILAYSHEKAV
jgi:hypothetical protein